MSLYRQPGRPAARTLAAAAAVALLVGGGAGYAIGSAGGDDKPSLRAAVARLRAGLEPVRAAMDLVPTEYAQAVRNGRVAAPTEYAAAKADVRRAREVMRRHGGDFSALYPLSAATVNRLLAELGTAIDRRADRREIVRLARAIRATLAAAFQRTGQVAPGIIVVP